MQKDSATPGVAHLRLLSDALEELCAARTEEDVVRISGAIAQQAAFLCQCARSEHGCENRSMKIDLLAEGREVGIRRAREQVYVRTTEERFSRLNRCC